VKAVTESQLGTVLENHLDSRLPLRNSTIYNRQTHWSRAVPGAPQPEWSPSPPGMPGAPTMPPGDNKGADFSET